MVKGHKTLLPLRTLEHWNLFLPIVKLGFILNAPIVNHQSISNTVYVIRYCAPPSGTDTTGSSQPADENLETLLCVPLSCEQYCSSLRPGRVR